MIEVSIQRGGPSVKLLSQSIIPFPCLMAAFACALCPAFRVRQPFFLGSSPPGHLRVLDKGLRKTVIRIQPKRKQEILDNILLRRPASGIGLRDFHCIQGRSSRHDGNEFGSGWGSVLWRCHPSIPPPSSIMPVQVGIPLLGVLPVL